MSGISSREGQSNADRSSNRRRCRIPNRNGRRSTKGSDKTRFPARP